MRYLVWCDDLGNGAVFSNEKAANQAVKLYRKTSKSVNLYTIGEWYTDCPWLADLVRLAPSEGQGEK